MSGEKRGLLATAVRGCFSCLTPLYRTAVAWRNRKFDRAIKRNDQAVVKRAAVPVISIGNLTTGGTGKTPLVVAVAKLLRQQSKRVALISRGYGADPSQPGRNDEAMELEHRLQDVPHLQDPDRFAMAAVAVEELESEVLLLDDGFQHRQLHRDLDIVTIDATNPFGFGRLLPRGLLREPVKSLRRADLVVVTRSNLVDATVLDALIKEIQRWVGSKNILITEMKLLEAINASGEVKPLADLLGQPTFLFSAIGNPAGFEQTLLQQSANLVGHEVFADHHRYDQEDFQRIGDAAKRASAQQILCTHKDLVKVGADRIGGLPVYAVLIEVEVVAGQQMLTDSLTVCCRVTDGSLSQ